MFDNGADESWQRAEECRREAERAIKADDRAAWLSLADEWLRLAQKTAVSFTIAATRDETLVSI
jgi:hypothetical protein